MKITMIGTGYVGLVSGACLADFGHVVTCVDKDAAKVERLRAGGIPIYEPGLDDLVARNVAGGRLYFDTDAAEAVAGADAVFIAVGTPAGRGAGHADLSYVYAAAEEIADFIDGFTVVVTKSTVPVGTGDEIERIIRARRPDAQVAVVSNPEFLREGAAIEDFKQPDRIVIGADDQRGRDVMSEIYRPFAANETPILFTSRRTSELIKYAANAFLAMKITFINEMADLCEAVGADVQQVARGIGLDKRIGAKFLDAGPGYGGSCFPKDTLALLHTAELAGSPVRLIETAVEVNRARKLAMADKVAEALGDMAGRTIGVLGLTFKPDTDDMRDAPSLDIVPALQAMGARVQAYDPQDEEARRMLKGVIFAEDAYAAARGADAVVIITEWDEFRALDLGRIKALMTRAVLVDLRNIYSPDDLRELGFHYVSVGRPDGGVLGLPKPSPTERRWATGLPRPDWRSSAAETDAPRRRETLDVEGSIGR